MSLSKAGGASQFRLSRPILNVLVLVEGVSEILRSHEHPLVEPQVSHFRQVPLRTMVKLPHSEQLSPS